MTKSYLSLLSLFLLSGILLSGCATRPTSTSKDKNQIVTSKERADELLKKNEWRINGKIAFIQKIKSNKDIIDKRESASIIWQVNENKQTQELNLTSYLGINVLHLTSNKNQHLIKVDGKEYRDTNLSQLLYSLTGLTLPTESLTLWLKGLPYKEDDVLKIDEKTQLPISISSYYHNEQWQIDYSSYKFFNGFNMATELTIKKDDLLIKVAIKNWSFND